MKCAHILKSNLFSRLTFGVFRRAAAPKYQASNAIRKEKRQYAKLLWR